MAVTINPGSVNPSGTPRRDAPPREKQRRLRAEAPAQAEVNFIPSEESLVTLIRHAVVSMRQGTFWDRGSILNLLV